MMKLVVIPLLLCAACGASSTLQGAPPPTETLLLEPVVPPLTTVPGPVQHMVQIKDPEVAVAHRGPAMQVSPTQAPPPTTVTTETLVLPPHYNSWLKIAECESGGNWQIATGNGFYGGLQFTLTSWKGAGGLQYAKYPHHASMLGQMWTAEKLLDLQGWGAWPHCSKYR